MLEFFYSIVGLAPKLPDEEVREEFFCQGFVKKVWIFFDKIQQRHIVKVLTNTFIRITFKRFCTVYVVFMLKPYRNFFSFFSIFVVRSLSLTTFRGLVLSVCVRILSNGLSSVGIFHLAFLQATFSLNNGWMVRLKNSRILTIVNGEKR